MRADFIFGNRVGAASNELYEISYITYFLCDLLSKKSLNKENIINKLEERIGGKINNRRFVPFLNANFDELCDLYTLKDYQADVLAKTNKFKEDLFILEWEQDNELYSKIGDFINSNHFDISKSLVYVLALEKNKTKKTTEQILSKYFEIVMNQDKILTRLDSSVLNIDRDYNDLSLKIIIDDKNVLDLMFANGLFVVGDLSSVSIESLLTLIAIDYERCVSSFEQLNEESKLTFKDELRNIFEGDVLSLREKQVIAKRNGFGCEKETLEEIGQEYNLTRERCRQIESKATTKISSKVRKIKNQIIMLFVILTTSIERRYISTDKFVEYMGDELLAKYYLFLIENGSFNLDLKYDEKLNIVYNSTLISLEELAQEVIDVYGPFIFKADYDALNKFEQSVIQANYRKYYQDFYLLRGHSPKELFGLIIDETFPNGYRVGNEDDIALAVKKFQEKFKTDESPSGHSIQGYLERLGYCQIGKGTYKNREQCVQLSQDLIDSVVNYILLNSPTVYYQSIYEHFKAQLNEVGIDNYYYLKGLIDPVLPDDFKTKRNYIIVGGVKITGNEAMVKYIRTFNGKFSINELREKYPGVKDYTFYNILMNEINNGLIWLANKNFIYIDKVVVSEESIKQLKQFIDELFIQLDTDTTSSRKIFAKLSLTNRSLLESLKIATDNFSMFSLIKYWFKDEYGFNRPLISKSKDINVNTYSLITNFANSQDSFNHRTIANYVNKMNIGGLYSYLSFIEDMSDNFVQVNIDTMYKKEKIPITDEQLKEFKGMLELIFSRFESIDTRYFNGYQMLPNIKYHWNKYLLAGIVRSYFSDDYEIENTDSAYDVTDFIIRRNK